MLRPQAALLSCTCNVEQTLPSWLPCQRSSSWLLTPPAAPTHPPTTACRLLVLFIFPATLMSSYALRAVVFFKRGKIPDKEASTLVAA